MRSATSFFDKTLFRSQLKHTWPLWLGYTALWLFLVPVMLFSELSAYQGGYSAADASYLLLNTGVRGGIFISFFFGLFFAMLAFSHLTQSRATNGFHALPVRRETIFLTAYLTGLFCQVSSILVTFLLGAAVGRHYDAVVAKLKAHLSLLGTAFLVTAAADLYFTWRSQCFGEVFPWFEALHLVYAMAAIFFCFAAFAKVCEKLDALPAFFALCDRSSYLIYLAHVLPIYAANHLIQRIGGMTMATAYLFRFVFTYAVTFGGCLCYTYVKEKIKERLQHANGRTNQDRA